MNTDKNESRMLPRATGAQIIGVYLRTSVDNDLVFYLISYQRVHLARVGLAF